MKLCQYCLKELKNKRRKNCEHCSATDVSAFRDGKRDAWLEAMQNARADDSLTPEQRRERGQSALTGESEWEKSKREREQRHRERVVARKQRQHDNAIMRQHGYHWLYIDDTDMYQNAPDPEWVLCAPDKKPISKSAAMKIVAGEMTLEEHRATSQPAPGVGIDADMTAKIEWDFERQLEMSLKKHAIPVVHFEEPDNMQTIWQSTSFVADGCAGESSLKRGQLNGTTVYVLTSYESDQPLKIYYAHALVEGLERWTPDW